MGFTCCPLLEQKGDHLSFVPPGFLADGLKMGDRLFCQFNFSQSLIVLF
jgi:hypothetical protein